MRSVLAGVWCVSAVLGLGSSVRVAIHTEKAPSNSFSSQGLVVNPSGWLTTSLQHGLDPVSGVIVSGGAAAQTRQAMNNLVEIFDASGYSMSDIATSCWVYMVNEDTDFDAISTVYKEYFPHDIHPTRSPPGVGLSVPGALVGVQCEGFPGDRLKIMPDNFFPTDFNSQGVVADNALLYTAGQVGADPVSGDMVSGGALNETAQALSNLETVFSTAFPSLGADAMSQRTTECQVMIGGDEKNWSLVKQAVGNVFRKDPPAFTYIGIDPGAGASVEVSCSGANPSVHRSLIPSTHASTTGPGAAGTLLRYNSLTLLHSAAQLGVHGSTPHDMVVVEGGVRSEMIRALANSEDVFVRAFPSLAASSHHGRTMRAAATQCTLYLASADDADDAEAVYREYFGASGLEEDGINGIGNNGRGNVLPAITTVVVGLPFGASVAVQCHGAM